MFAGGSADGATLIITVPITDNVITESLEIYNVNLSNVISTGVASISDNLGVGTILDNDASSVAINDMTVDESAGTAVFTVTLSGAIQDALSVDYATSDVSALNPSDYAATSGTLIFAAGSSDGATLSIIVPITDNVITEPLEIYNVNLSNVVSTGVASISDNLGVGTILDNDVSSVAINDMTVDESAGTAVFTVTLNNAVQNNFTVNFATANNNAIQPGDYILTSGTLTFGGANSLIQTITVPIIDDPLVEPTEYYYVDLSGLVINGQAITIADAQGLGTIINNDLPTIACPSDITQNNDQHVCTALVTIPFEVFATNWPGALLSWTMTGATSGSGTGQIVNHTFNKGVTTITYVAYDLLSNNDPNHINTATCSFTVTVVDNEKPTFTRPADITLYTDANCSYDATIAVTGDVTNEWDNCSVGIQATYIDLVIPNCQGTYTIKRTWHLVDYNGNAAADQVQTITVLDNIKPTFTRPPDYTFQSDDVNQYNASPSITGDVTNEHDNCSTSLQATYTDVIMSGTCYGSKVIHRTWHLVDNCGNQAPDQVQTIIVVSGYVILVKDYVTMSGVKVISGGVGIKSDAEFYYNHHWHHHHQGIIGLNNESYITGTGTFAKAAHIYIDNTSAATDTILSPANVPWPVFEGMPYTGTINVNVPNNTTVYLTDTLYKTIKVGRNATVVFTKPIVNVSKEVDMERGSTMRFMQCTKFRAARKFETSDNITLNPDNVSVNFYVDDDVTFGAGCEVNGLFYLGDANAEDTAKHRLAIGGEHDWDNGHGWAYWHHHNHHDWYHGNNDDEDYVRPGVYTGMFIAQKLYAYNNNFFYLNTNCNNCPTLADYGPFTCPSNATLCAEDSTFRLMDLLPPYTNVASITNNQPSCFLVGTTLVTWTVKLTNGTMVTCKQYVTRSGMINVSITSNGSFCNNNEVKLTSSVTGTPATLLQWSTGATTSSITANSNGDYFVTARNSLGCYAKDSITIDMSPKNLISSYVMFAKNQVTLDATHVNSGGIGAMDYYTNDYCHNSYNAFSQGWIDADDHTYVTTAGTFAKASNIYVDLTSSILQQYIAPASIYLPHFEANPNAGTSIINVANNTTVTLTDTIYKSITIGTNATVIFTKQVVNIGRTLTIGNGSTVKFAKCSKVRITGYGSNAIFTGSLVNINPDSASVVFYVHNNVCFGSGNHVWGTFYLSNAGTPGYDMTTGDSHSTRSGVFRGMFIAQTIKSNNNTYWYLKTPCDNCGSFKELEAPTNKMVLENYPNPFSDITTILFKIPTDNHAKLDVYDLTGKLLETLFNGYVNKNQEYSIEFNGTPYTTGMYIYKLTTNNNVVTGKMVLNKQE
jgi:hypothetical protein